MRRYAWSMRTESTSSKQGLTALDGAKIIGAIVLVIVVLKVVGAIVGAIMSIVWGALIVLAVAAAAWVVFSLVRGGSD
jgi:hypothetical protein